MTSLLTRRPGRRASGPRVGLFGLLGTGNLGNDGSLQAMLALVRAEYPDAEFDCLCSGPEEIETRFGLPATRLNWYRDEYTTATGAAVGAKLLGKIIDPIHVWAWVRRHDVVIVPGMGVLEGCFSLASVGLALFAATLSVAGRCSRAKIALVSVGADELARALNRRMIVWAARLAHYRSFRDLPSREAVYAMGLDAAADDEVYPDLAFALPVPPEERRRIGRRRRRHVPSRQSYRRPPRVGPMSGESPSSSSGSSTTATTSGSSPGTGRTRRWQRVSGRPADAPRRPRLRTG